MPGILLENFNRQITRHLAWIDSVTSGSPRYLSLSALLLVLLSMLSVLSVRFETDIFRLFPADRPAMKLFLDSLEWSGGAREAYFLLEGEPSGLAGEAHSLSIRLRDLRIDGAPAFKRVIYRIYDESEAERFNELVMFAAAHPAAFVPLKDAALLAERLKPESVAKALEQLTVQIAGSIGSGGVPLSAADPVGLRDFILPRLKAGSQALDMDPSSPYFISRDGKVLIMIAEPARPVQDMEFARKLVAGINQARSGSKARVSCAGAHISAVIDEAAMKQNIIACILSSLVVVLGIFYAVYRRLWPTLMIPLILAIGVLLSLGTAGLFLSGIHIISFAFMALIIGLGTDYSIHLYDRFHTMRTAGASTDEAVSRAVVDTGHGLFTAAMTTALPFLALGGSEVRALSELGILVGLGVIFSLYATLFLMPLLLRLTDSPAATYHRLPALGMGAVWRFSGFMPRMVVWLSVLVLVTFAIFSIRTSFDGDLKNLQPRHSEAFHAQELVEKHLNLAPKSLLVAVDGVSQKDVLEKSIKVEQMASTLEMSGMLQSWSGLGQIMNRQQEQQKIVSIVKASTISSSALENMLRQQGFEPESFRRYLDFIKNGSLAKVIDEPEVIRNLAVSPLRGVIERHLVQDSTGWHGLVYLYFKPGQIEYASFAKLLNKEVPYARITGTEPVSNELLEAVQKSAINGISIGSVIVLILLLVHFRNFSGILSTLGPVFFGTVAMLGAMVLAGMKLNFMNIMVLVTIIGMGSDYGLHIWHRCVNADRAGQEQAFIQAGRSVLLSALTTIAGFGSLAFTDYGAMSSIGWATNFGIGFTALAALLVVPAALRMRL